MATEAIGYDRLIQTYQLPARPLARLALIDSSNADRGQVLYQRTSMQDLTLFT